MNKSKHLKNKVLLVLAGEVDIDLNQIIDEYDLIIAVDGGLKHLDKICVSPDFLIGDLDSSSNFSTSKIIKFDSEKDDTDFACAINFINENFNVNNFDVVGFASLNRVDHVLTNLSLIDEKMKFISNNQEIYCKSEDFTVIADEFQYISFYSLSVIESFTLSGFKYPLDNYTLKPFDPLCISNELVDFEGKVSVSDGKVIVIKSKLS